MTEINNDFDKLAEQINAKLKEAATALREAAALGDKAGLNGLIYTQWVADAFRSENSHSDSPLSKVEVKEKLQELENQYDKIDASEFEMALGRAGWSASSSYC